MASFTGKQEPTGLDELSVANANAVREQRRKLADKRAARRAQDAAYPQWLEAEIIANRPQTVKPSGGLAWMLAALTAASVTCGPALWVWLGR